MTVTWLAKTSLLRDRRRWLKWLTALRRMNPGEADLVLLIAGVLDSDGVAVGNPDAGR
ncbi:MAG: hypothetical protein M3294_01750 [Pseudomonadota bacterium]|nr:hypothetical protein [Pseudomonadota bacterium]